MNDLSSNKLCSFYEKKVQKQKRNLSLCFQSELYWKLSIISIAFLVVFNFIKHADYYSRFSVRQQTHSESIHFQEFAFPVFTFRMVQGVGQKSSAGSNPGMEYFSAT